MTKMSYNQKTRLIAQSDQVPNLWEALGTNRFDQHQQQIKFTLIRSQAVKKLAFESMKVIFSLLQLFSFPMSQQSFRVI